MAALNQPTTVYVTGGMSGIGRALASAYIRRGAHVAIFDLTVDDAVLDELSNETLHSGQIVAAYQASVTDSTALNEAVTQAVTTMGAPQLALNCAGIQRAQPFNDLSEEHFEQVVQVNLIGSRNFAAAVLPTMGSGSRLALVSSMAGFVANYSYAAYSASKFGVIGLGRVLRLEYKPRGIAVSLICPPEVNTPMVVDEMKNMHPASRRLKEFGGSLSLPAAITMILAGIDAGRDVIIPGGKAKLAYFCGRYLPDFIMNFIADKIVRSVLRTMKRDEPTRVES
tara:strand:+ start:10754 stop:11599 length:846 start_codon:yes stop_codon:yes gene_type:complete